MIEGRAHRIVFPSGLMRLEWRPENPRDDFGKVFWYAHIEGFLFGELWGSGVNKAWDSALSPAHLHSHIFHVSFSMTDMKRC